MKSPSNPRNNAREIDLVAHIWELLENNRLIDFDTEVIQHASGYSAHFFPDNEEATEASLKEAVTFFLIDHCLEARLIDPSSPEGNDTPPTKRAPDQWLSRNFKFQPVMIPFCEQMAEQVAGYNGHSRSDYKQNVVGALMVILGNIYHNHSIEPEMYCIVNLANNSWAKGIYNSFGLGIRSVSDVVCYLRDPEFDYLDIIGGNFNRNLRKPKGEVTRVRGRPRLIEGINDYLRTTSEGSNGITSEGSNGIPSVTRNTYLGEDPHSPLALSLYHQVPLPIIRLRNEDGSNNEDDYLDETMVMGERLSSYNSFIRKHWVDLLVPDQTLKELSTGRDQSNSEDEKKDHQESFSLCFDNQLHRVFNNGSFDQGGRFYGGWWQSIKSDYRKFITINWYTTREVDYSNLAAAMLYAKEGHELPDDAYSIEGISTDYRKLIKQTFFKLINATGQVRAPKKGTLPEGWTWKQLQEALADKHRIISEYFNSGIGIYLQKVDADIAELVMLEMMSRDKLALPIHDSFIVRDGYEGELTEVMKDAYRSTMQAEVKTDPSVSWADELPESVFELDQHGVSNLEDNIGEKEQQEGYERYLARKRAFTRDPENEHNLRKFGLYP